MTKTGVLEAISYKNRRVKFGTNWFAVDPFVKLDNLKISQEYSAEFNSDKGIFYIEKFALPQVAE